MIVGLGSGDTAARAIRMLGGRNIVGVATSEKSAALARSVGIAVRAPDDVAAIDLTIDGADEIDPELRLIKGGGGAHTREKIVSHASRHNVIVVDEGKLSSRLGEKWPVPIEVLPFGERATAAHLAAFGRPVPRERGGAPFRTDAGNRIYDVHTGPIDDPEGLERAMRAIPGVVEVGLFVQRADVVLVAGPMGVRRL